jgi:hypothetical protein
MPVALVVMAALVLVAIRYPVVNHLAGWLIVFPIVTVSGGSIAWGILIQRWDAFFSLCGYGMTLAVFAVPVSVWVCRLNRA